ncbi:MAG: hypothetical protein IJ193_09440 [Bacilli bacterium]|nr:hypothetical protein [Bacilli bacterium]
MMNSIEKLDQQIEMLTSKKFRERTTISAAFQPIERKRKVILEEPTKVDIMADLLPDTKDETVVFGMKDANLESTKQLNSIDAIRFERTNHVSSTKNYNVIDFITDKYAFIKKWVYDYINTGDLDEKISDLLSIILCMIIIFIVLFTIIL